MSSKACPAGASRALRRWAIAAISLAIGAIGCAIAGETAPGAPGAPSTWAYAAKTGVGTSYEVYSNGRYKDDGGTGAVSKVWFSVADGVLTETMYGLIHEAQIKELRFAVQTESALAVEGTDTISRTEYLHADAKGRPLSPAYKIVTRDKASRFEIEKHVFTDPDRDALFLRVTFRALKGPITPYLLLEPHMTNTGGGDDGQTTKTGLHASEAGTHLVLKSSKPFEQASAGFVGRSDGLTDLKADGRLDWAYESTGADRGSIMLAARLAPLDKGEATYDFVIGFGRSQEQSEKAAEGSLQTGYREVLARYNGEGSRVGWEDYIASLKELPKLAEIAEDGGKLAYVSALMLKVQEDKTHAGALIASLSNPWGDTVFADKSSTGYKAVWPRDFYQCAMALAALGDRETPVAAFRYLPTVQVGPNTRGNKGAGGWFLQKSHVDGTPEWVGVQLDQTAMPIMLGWKLWKLDLLSKADLKDYYARMLKPAADFLTDGGALNIDWNKETIRPPYTQQERWEEQPGHSPSTTAAVIAGLVTAGDIAELSGDAQGAARYRDAADRYSAAIERRMFTTNGRFGNGRYFVRTSLSEDANDHGRLEERNGRPGAPVDQVVDAGFLELVRYGVRRADDPYILESLPELDDESREDLLRVRYSFTFPGVDGTFSGWRRYGNDGYGEDAETGANYGVDNAMTPGQRGRVWPFFTGERGHYELALASVGGKKPDAKTVKGIRGRYVRAMELFANDGLLLPEQVWDAVGKQSTHAYVKGEGTDSATPLAWAHAEYVKLLRSLRDGEVWDSYAPVKARYAR